MLKGLRPRDGFRRIGEAVTARPVLTLAIVGALVLAGTAVALLKL